MGSIIGGIYASGGDMERLYEYVVEKLDITGLLDAPAFHLSGPAVRVLLAGQALGRLASKPGIDSGAQIEALVDQFLVAKRIEDCPIPFRCNAVDLVTGKEVVFRHGSLNRAIRASMAVPMVFDPVIIDAEDENGGNKKMCLVDGGLADNLPVHLAEAEGYKHILAVDVGSVKNIAADELVSVPKIAARCLEIVMFSMAHREDYREKALIINASDDSTPLSFDRKLQLLARGKQALTDNRELLDKFFD
jgi:NTE family protein